MSVRMRLAAVRKPAGRSRKSSTRVRRPCAAMRRSRATPEFNTGGLAQRRKRDRDYMRRWRAVATNLASEKRRADVCKWQKKLASMELPINDRTRCAYCRKKAAMLIDRLSVTPTGFREVRLGYCGNC